MAACVACTWQAAEPSDCNASASVDNHFHYPANLVGWGPYSCWLSPSSVAAP